MPLKVSLVPCALALALSSTLVASAVQPFGLPERVPSIEQEKPATPPAEQAEKKDEPKKKHDLPLKTDRTISFDTDEGTWLSLDVTPDGRTIVFELAGDLYRLPMAGGTATRI